MGRGAGVGGVVGAQSREGTRPQSTGARYVFEPSTQLAAGRLQSMHLDWQLADHNQISLHLVAYVLHASVFTLSLLLLGGLVVHAGAGVGLPALAAALAVGNRGSGATEIAMTDMYPELLKLMQR